MVLQIGQKIKGETQNITFTVRKKLGEGTQGEVYLVEGGGGKFACKWYKLVQATGGQKSAIRALVRSGPPRGPSGNRFIWPLDLVASPGSSLFGYTMRLIDMDRFATLGEVQAHLKPVPSFSTLCTISYQLANSYRALHLNGYCYRDIADGNLMFDPHTGDVLICDNDNVGVNRQSHSQVWGTMEYMAPELIRGEKDPSTETDLHSLAVLLFHLWCWHHPLHGSMEFRFRVWDLPAKRKVYGEEPVFIFHPTDSRNRLPEDPDYATAKIRWAYCPPSLREMFTQAFTIGLADPKRRVTEGEWQREFLQLRDSIVSCTRCSAENFEEIGVSGSPCWHCRAPIPPHPKLAVRHSAGVHYLTLTEGAKILKRHLSTPWQEEEKETVIGEVVQHPQQPGVWGIRNLSSRPWKATTAGGEVLEIPPQKAVPLNPGFRILIEGAEVEIIP
ncbi:MAG: protein kinase [Methanomicrobiales archaeon]|nr:protein kinase [Methanomicrobiales archaeon]